MLGMAYIFPLHQMNHLLSLKPEFLVKLTTQCLAEITVVSPKNVTKVQKMLEKLKGVLHSSLLRIRKAVTVVVWSNSWTSLQHCHHNGREHWVCYNLTHSSDEASPICKRQEAVVDTVGATACPKRIQTVARWKTQPEYF